MTPRATTAGTGVLLCIAVAATVVEGAPHHLPGVALDSPVLLHAERTLARGRLPIGLLLGDGPSGSVYGMDLDPPIAVLQGRGRVRGRAVVLCLLDIRDARIGSNGKHPAGVRNPGLGRGELHSGSRVAGNPDARRRHRKGRRSKVVEGLGPYGLRVIGARHAIRIGGIDLLIGSPPWSPARGSRSTRCALPATLRQPPSSCSGGCWTTSIGPEFVEEFDPPARTRSPRPR